MTAEVIESISSPAEVIATALTPKKSEEPVRSFKGCKVEILEKAVRVTFLGGVTKIVSIADYLNVVQVALEKEQAIKSQTPFLMPPNVIYFAVSATALDVMCYYPETIREVTFITKKRLSVLPNIIISVQLKTEVDNTYNVKQARYLCTNRSLEELERIFYRARTPEKGVELLPFPNIYEEANLCTGGNSMITKFTNNDLRPLSWYHDVLWASPFNNDLGVKALKIPSRFNPETWTEYLAQLAINKEPFPYSELRAFS